MLRACPCELWSAGRARQLVSAIELVDFQRVEVDPVGAAQIDLHHRSVRAGAVGERGAAAGAAELEPDDLLVPLIAAQFFLGALEAELVGRSEVMERRPPPADRTVALHRLGRNVFVDRVAELAAMTASLECHRLTPCWAGAPA